MHPLYRRNHIANNASITGYLNPLFFDRFELADFADVRISSYLGLKPADPFYRKCTMGIFSKLAAAVEEAARDE